MPRPLASPNAPGLFEILSETVSVLCYSMPLGLSLLDLAEKHGVAFISFHRIGAHGGKLAIRTSEMYYMLTATVPGDRQSRDEIDDYIYDDIKQQIESILEEENLLRGSSQSV